MSCSNDVISDQLSGAAPGLQSARFTNNQPDVCPFLPVRRRPYSATPMKQLKRRSSPMEPTTAGVGESGSCTLSVTLGWSRGLRAEMTVPVRERGQSRGDADGGSINSCLMTSVLASGGSRCLAFQQLRGHHDCPLIIIRAPINPGLRRVAPSAVPCSGMQTLNGHSVNVTGPTLQSFAPHAMSSNAEQRQGGTAFYTFWHLHF